MNDIDLESILRDVFGGSFGGFGDAFGGFSSFGGRSSKRGSSRGSDARITLNLTFEEACFGCEKELDVNLKAMCDNCNGKGGFHEKTCTTCGGNGVVVLLGIVVL